MTVIRGFNGHTTSYTYDDSGRLVVRSPDAFFANEAPVQFSYSASGRRTQRLRRLGRD